MLTKAAARSERRPGWARVPKCKTPPPPGAHSPGSPPHDLRRPHLRGSRRLRRGDLRDRRRAGRHRDRAGAARRGLRVLLLESAGGRPRPRRRRSRRRRTIRPDNHHRPHITVARRLGGTSNSGAGAACRSIRSTSAAALARGSGPGRSPRPISRPGGAACERLGAGEPVFHEPLPGVTADDAFGFESAGALEQRAAQPSPAPRQRWPAARTPGRARRHGARLRAMTRGRIAAIELHLEGRGTAGSPRRRGAGRRRQREHPAAARRAAPAAGALRRGGRAARPVLHGPCQRPDRRHRSSRAALARRAGLPRQMATAPTCAAAWCRPRRRRSASRLANVAFWPVVPAIADPAHRSGPLSAMFLALSVGAAGRRLIAEPIRLKHVGPPPYRRGRASAERAARPPRDARLRAVVSWKNQVAQMRLPGFFLQNPARRYGLEYHSEHLPDAESRLTLANHRPAGAARLAIDLRFSEADAASVVRAHEALGGWLVRNGLGRLDWRVPPEERAAVVLAAGQARQPPDRHDPYGARPGHGGGGWRLPQPSTCRTSTWSPPPCCRPRARPIRR